MAARLADDRELLAAVLGRLARAVLQDRRCSVKREHGIASALPLHGVVVTVAQRFRLTHWPREPGVDSNGSG